MDLFEAIRTRRSVKQFDPAHTISDDELRRLLELAALTPSSFNMQNWHVVAVRDPAMKAALRADAWNQPQVEEAAMVLVIAGRLTAWRDSTRTLRKAAEGVRAHFAKMIPGFYADDKRLQRDEACRSVGLFGMNLMLLARGFGWDSCPMIGFDPAAVAAHLGLPDDQPPLLMLPMGRARAEALPRLGLLNLEEFVSLETFGRHELQGEVPDPCAESGG